MKGSSIEVRSVLAAFAAGEECTSLMRILGGAGWDLQFAPGFAVARDVLHSFPNGVVMCTRRFEDGHCWKDILNELHGMPIPPPLIVADRLADESLWAEVLNFGCYDLLMTPFDAEEALRVVTLAWEFFRRKRERTVVLPKPPKSAELHRQFSARASAAGIE
jgi:DNA-binding NtrC family response regulator